MGVGENIKTARKVAKLSQSDLAKAIGSTKSTISKYELGRREPSLDIINRIAQATGFTPAFIVSGEVGTSVTHLSNGVHIYKALNLFDTINEYLHEAHDNDESILYQDDYLIVTIDKGASASSDEVTEIIKTHRPEYIDNNSLTKNAATGRIVELYKKLNNLGQQKAVERIEELTEIPKYQRRDTPQPPSAAPEDDNASSTEKPPESP